MSSVEEFTPVQEKRTKNKKTNKKQHKIKKKARQEGKQENTINSETNANTAKYGTENILGTTEELLTKYQKMSRTDLEVLCERVLLYDKTGIYIPPELYKLDCHSKKQKGKLRELKEHTCAEVNSKLGKGLIGVSCEKFGHVTCSCCNPANFCYDLPVNIKNEVPESDFEDTNTTQGEALDLSKPSCSGIGNMENHSQVSEVTSSADIMDFVKSLNLQMDCQTLEESIWPLNSDSTIDINELSRITSSLLDSIKDVPAPELNINEQENEIEVVDLTNVSDPWVPTAFIDLVEKEFKTNITPGEVEIIDLVDSDSDTENNASKQSHLSDDKKSVEVVPAMECPVCLESLKNKKIMSTNCGHIFCAGCIRNVIKKTKRCPNCRKRLNNNSIHPLYFNF